MTVWALARSLAATWAISVDFFSSDYLDVSVHRVLSPKSTATSRSGFPHSGIRESMSAATRHGISLLSAPFFVRIRLGIRLAPFLV